MRGGSEGGFNNKNRSFGEVRERRECIRERIIVYLININGRWWRRRRRRRRERSGVRNQPLSLVSLSLVSLSHSLTLSFSLALSLSHSLILSRSLTLTFSRLLSPWKGKKKKKKKKKKIFFSNVTKKKKNHNKPAPTTPNLSQSPSP